MVHACTMIRLCWIICSLLLSFVSGQTFGGTTFNRPFPLGPFRIPVGGGLPNNGPPGGGIIPIGFPTPPQREKRPFKSAQPDQKVPITAESPSAVPAPIATPTKNDEIAVVRPENPSSTSPLSPPPPPPPPPPSSSLVPFVQPASNIASSSTAIAQPALASSRPSIATSSNPPSITGLSTKLATTYSSTSTVTTSVTVIVTPSAVAGTTSPSASPTALLNIVSNTPSKSAMSPSARAGLGLGVTFGLISVASITGFYLYRRYMNKHQPSRTSARIPLWKPKRGWFNFRKDKSPPKDIEWEIASAEKVEIVRGASARTMNRSDSKREGGNGGIVGEGNSEGPYVEIMRVGLQIPERTRPPNSGLNMHPPSWPLSDRG
ncbi:hypothetical protein P154DRAFT_615430 [Amniculicola lignicola CBS 123094]|uniref:Mid2 domain-containing protein n=1 Tax=Amniculicola lignicola CBS 123094 TaxID=1392246 RepID=A0A6A5X1E5_9PLEO|nr:hypothetical protein P154DRAFT_615430 [Amniculicola lignicola CBS 123094]